MKENKWILNVVAFFMMMTVITLSFAYFTATITINGNVSSTKGNVRVNEADITLTSVTSNVSLSGTYPMTKTQADDRVSPYSFQVKNNSLTKSARIQIVLEIKSGNTINDNLVSASIETVYGALTDSTKFTLTSSTQEGYTRGYVLLNDTIAIDQTKSYDLRLWLNELGNNIDSDENNVENKTWYGKVVVKAAEYQDSTPSNND